MSNDGSALTTNAAYGAGAEARRGAVANAAFKAGVAPHGEGNKAGKAREMKGVPGSSNAAREQHRRIEARQEKLAAAQCLTIRWKGREKPHPAIKVARDAMHDFLLAQKELRVRERGGSAGRRRGNLPGRRVHRKGGGYFPE